MSYTFHLGKNKIGICKNGKISYMRVKKASKNRFFTLYHSGLYDTYKTGLLMVIFR